MRGVWQASVWHPDAIPPDEWDHRHQRRVSLPLLDSLMIAAGVWAMHFGSPLLNDLFKPELVDLGGAILAVSAATCLFGVVFPRLWGIELVGKTALVFLLVTYASAITFFPRNPDPSSGFVAFIICAMLVFPCTRMIELIEKRKRKRAEKGRTYG